MASEPNETKLLLDFLLAHPTAIATLTASVVAIATSYAAAVAAGWQAANYLNKREIKDNERRIDDLNVQHQRDLTSIKAQVTALDEQFPSIGDIDPIVDPFNLGEKAERYSDFNIALTERQPSSLWVLEQKSLKEIFSEWFGSSLTDDLNLREGYRLIADDHEQLCLLWKGTRAVSVENNEVMKKMYPFVIVRSIRHEAGADPTTEELFNFIYWLQMWDKAMPNARFEIIKMHRTPNKAYLRGYFRFGGLTIGENSMRSARRYHEYFLMRQIFVFRSDIYTTIISTGLPNRDLVTDSYYQPLKAWWEALRIIKRTV